MNNTLLLLLLDSRAPAGAHHHSAGMETISSPELFIAAVAERTRNIRLGTGVISLPYHNPLMVADRIV